MSQEDSQLSNEDLKVSFVRKSDDEYWVFFWRSWGEMLKKIAKCKECGKMPSSYWCDINAQGKIGKRRMYACSLHRNEVFRMVLEL